MNLLHGLVRPSSRLSSATELARLYEAEDLLILIEDHETSALLPAPLFPQTLRPSEEWIEFLRECGHSRSVRRNLVSPFSGQAIQTLGFRTGDGSVVVFFGLAAIPHNLETLLVTMPLVGESLRNEHKLSLARLQLQTTKTLAEQSNKLSHLLEEVTLRLQRSLHERDELILEQRAISEALRESAKARDEFLSIVSHELKTPLTSLKLQVQLRSRAIERAQVFTTDKLRHMVASDARQIDRIGRLIEDMFMARVGSGKIPLHKEQLDLAVLAKETVAQFDGHLEIEGTEVKVNCTDGATGVWDRFRLEQVVTNLLTNAFKYGQKKPVELTVQTEGADALLSVRDQGPGIAKNDQQRIFMRFERAVSSNEVSGLGLGLYIVKEIVEAHSGQVWVESELGKGATFIVRLPRNIRDLQRADSLEGVPGGV